MENFDKLKDYLNYKEWYPDEQELKDIINLAIETDAFENHKGYRHERVNSCEREMAFYQQWLKENEPRAGVNHGNGILQDLFIERKGGFYPTVFDKTVWVEEINNRDRRIVATIIQWLGTSCGMAFLHDALGRFDAYIAYKKKEEK